MTIDPHKLVGRLVFCAVALVAGASPESSTTRPFADEAPSLQGDAALAELERRGEKDSLLAAFTAITGPTQLNASNPDNGDGFGSSVAISGTTAVVGAPLEDGSGSGVDPAPTNTGFNHGAVYVFVRSGATWIQQAYLKPSNPNAEGGFGRSVALAGDTLIVGAPTERGTGIGPPPQFPEPNVGSVYVFVRRGTNWSQEAYLRAPTPRQQSWFGWSVALSGNTVVVGAPNEQGTGTGVNPVETFSGNPFGAAYVFVRNGATWSLQAYLKAFNTGEGDDFGRAVAISGNTVVIGAPHEDGGGAGVDPVSDENIGNAGAVYVFVRTNGSWSQQAYLKASAPEVNGQFGYSVSASGALVAVGAPSEGPLGGSLLYSPLTESESAGSGAVYVFFRSGSSWTPQARVTGPGNVWFEHFGTSVAMMGSKLVVGAKGESGSGTGVNPVADVDTTFSLMSGATFVFVRHGDAWGQQQYLKASDPANYSNFGTWVAVSRSGVAVGAASDFIPQPGIRAGSAYVFEAPDPLPLVHLDAGSDSDLLLYSPAGGAWSQQIGQASGAVVQQNTGLWAPGWSVKPANFNGDERTDFFVFNAGTGAWAKVLTGASDFTTESSGIWWYGWQRHVMDLNGDGLSDIFLYDPLSGVWFKCLSTPTGFTYAQGAWNPNWKIHPMDLNGDAYGDVFLFNEVTGRWFWALGQDDSGFTYPLTGTWRAGWQLYPGDFNGDGLTDLLLHAPLTGAYFVAMSTGSDFTYTQGSWLASWTPNVADLDGDRVDDIFLHNAATGSWLEVIANGAGAFTKVRDGDWSPGWKLHFTDVNGDERADIVLYNANSGAWQLARNLINGSFTFSTGTWAPGLTIVSR